MRDRHAVVWTRISGQPIKMGELYVTDIESRFIYDLSYLSMDLPGLGIILAPAIYGQSPVKWSRTAHFDFPPPIQSLVPPEGKHNFQRRLIMNYLQSIGVEKGSDFDNDWQILTLGGHGGIGHIDVFSSDEKAISWYSTPALPKKELLISDSSLGFSLKNMLTWLDDETGDLLKFLGPTPSVNGAIPKLLLSMPKAGWTGEVGLPTRFGDTQSTDVILKLEKDAFYPGIVELEALSLDIHAKAGFHTPRYWMTEFNGINAIAIERFDRDERCVPVFQETLYSILACGNKTIKNNYDATYDLIGRMFDNPRITLVDDRKAAKKHLLKRLILSFLIGNGDLHLENLSLQTRQGVTAFSPVYDPVPMRAYSIHNMLNVMPFGDYGDYLDGHETPVDFAHALKRFNHSLGFTHNLLTKIISELINISDDYADRVKALTHLPRVNKENLLKIHQAIKNQLANI